MRASAISLDSGRYLSISLTTAGRFAGTPRYMSPEQFHGKAIDARTDQYTFCVCLFEALYGENQLQKLGKYAGAESLLNELAPRVLALRFPPLKAEFAYQTALNLRFLGKYAEAEPALVESIQTALRYGMKELAAWAGSEATYLVGYHLQRYAEGLLYSIHAQGITRERGDELEARSLTSLASVYFVMGKYREAGVFDKRVLAIREKALGLDHPDVAQSLTNLGLVYLAQGKLKEAEELHQKALLIWEKTLGPEHPEVAKSQNNLANVTIEQGRFLEAEERYKKALAIREKALGPDHPLVARSLANLAIVCFRQEKLREAEELHKRALAIWEKALGADHPYMAESQVGLAETYEKQHRLEEALSLLERAREIREKGSVAPLLRAEVAFPLARILWATGKNRARARTLAQAALEHYQAAGAGAETERREVELWIKKHR